MGFHVLAKHGLNKHGLKDPNLVSFWDNQKKTGMKRGEGEKEKKRKRKIGRREEEPRSSKAKIKQSQAQKKGMELLTLSMDPWFCLVNGYLLYPNLGFVRI